MLEDLLRLRRDTRHFTQSPVPDEVLEKALKAGHLAPSVGLTEATRYYVIRAAELKQQIKELFDQYNQKATQQINDEAQREAYQALKLEAIVDAPLGLVICYDRSVLNDFTIGTVASNDTIKFSTVCAVQNIWLSLTEQGYSMGWVSILNYHQFKQLLNLPDHIEPLGYFCVGEPATDYQQQPMLQQLGWKTKSAAPMVTEVTTLATLVSSAPVTETPFTSTPVRETSVTETPGTENPVTETPLAVGPGYGKAESDKAIVAELQDIIDAKTKPIGALGLLETIARQAGQVFQTVKPKISKPHLVVFAADHGIAQHGVSAYPQEVTRQMVNNFLEGGAAINVFCRQHDIALEIVDAGVNYDFAPHDQITHAKIGRGTHSFLHQAAMSPGELDLCLRKGAETADRIYAKGANTIGFGEMGIGNTSTASVLMSVLLRIPLKSCIGAGTGINQEQLLRKQQLLQMAIDRYPGEYQAKELMAYFGGFEIMQIAGAIIGARKNNMLILIDGFICTVAYLCALQLDPDIRSNAIFCHQSNEQGHRLLLKELHAQPLLQLDLRLGEGTGCALAFPLIQSAVAFLNEMASFESAGVSNK